MLIPSNCSLCKLHEKRIQVVNGDGNLKADIMFLGEAPGASEDFEGKPFIGKAGKLLEHNLNLAGLTRKDVYITNIVKCRPPENRNPEDDEIEACHMYLWEEIKEVKPLVIITLGKYATQAMLLNWGINVGQMKKLVGKPIFNLKKKSGNEILEFNIIPAWHPAYILRGFGRKHEKEFLEVIRLGAAYVYKLKQARNNG